MKVQQIQQQNKINGQNPVFKGPADIGLRYLAVNQAVGANAVDVTFMVTPRTGTDWSKRGPLAGLETFRREIMGTINDSLIGLYGAIAGAAILMFMGVRKYTSGANQILAAPETLDILAENKAAQIRKKTSQADYLKNTLEHLKAYNPSAKNADKEGYVKLSENTVEDVSQILDRVINEKDLTYHKWNNVKRPDSINVLLNKIVSDTGSESDYILESAAGSSSSKTSLRTVLEDIFKISKSFNEDKVKKAFEEQVQNGRGIKDNGYVKALSKFLKNKSYAGFAFASAVGLSVQPINMYLTRLKTGSDGFVGVKGREKDNSTGFKVLKVVSSAAFFSMVLATLGTGLKGFMGKMATKGFWPTISQFKGIYGVTIISRLMSARDKDELRESFTKDSLGYLSWLVLGNYVNKMAAEALDDSVMNRVKEVKEDKNYFRRIFKSSLKTRDEILIKTLSDNGISTVKQGNGKFSAKNFREMIKDLDKLPPEVKKIARKQLSVLNKAQLAGYLFSGLVLGLGIPNLNIYITNKLDRMRKNKAEKNEKQNSAKAA